VREVAVLGAGNGGLAAAVDLSSRDHRVRVYNRSAQRIKAVRERGGIKARGILGNATFPVVTATTNLADAVGGVGVVVVVLPATAHAALAAELAPLLAPGTPVILNPGHMCGSLHIRRVFEGIHAPRPRIAETGTLTYVCRAFEPGTVDVYARADHVPLASVPGDDAELTALAQELFPGTEVVDLPIEAWLHDVNMILHPPGMILGASRIESFDRFMYYSEGVTDSVATVMEAVDSERRAVGTAFGLELPSLAGTMAALGTADPDAAHRGETKAAIAGGEANASIAAPTTLRHRYLEEDVPFGLVPLVALAEAAGVPVPVSSALIILAETILGERFSEKGLTAETLGIHGLGVDGVLAVAEGRS
jgi:opine dehydrogenase